MGRNPGREVTATAALAVAALGACRAERAPRQPQATSAAAAPAPDSSRIAARAVAALLRLRRGDTLFTHRVAEFRSDSLGYIVSLIPEGPQAPHFGGGGLVRVWRAGDSATVLTLYR